MYLYLFKNKKFKKNPASFTKLRLQRKSVYPKTSKELKFTLLQKWEKSYLPQCPLPPPSAQPVRSDTKYKVLCCLEVKVLSKWEKYSSYPLIGSPHNHIPKTRAYCKFQVEVTLFKRSYEKKGLSVPENQLKNLTVRYYRALNSKIRFLLLHWLRNYSKLTWLQWAEIIHNSHPANSP